MVQIPLRRKPKITLIYWVAIIDRRVRKKRPTILPRITRLPVLDELLRDDQELFCRAWCAFRLHIKLFRPSLNKKSVIAAARCEGSACVQCAVYDDLKVWNYQLCQSDAPTEHALSANVRNNFETSIHTYGTDRIKIVPDEREGNDRVCMRNCF